MTRRSLLRRALAGALGLALAPYAGKLAVAAPEPAILYAATGNGVYVCPPALGASFGQSMVRWDQLTGGAVVEHINAYGNRTSIPQRGVNGEAGGDPGTRGHPRLFAGRAGTEE
jgi:hypothetical protein